MRRGMKPCQLNPKSEFHPSNLWVVLFSVTWVTHRRQINLKGHSIITAVKVEQLLRLSQSEYLKGSKADAWINFIVWKSKNRLLTVAFTLLLNLDIENPVRLTRECCSPLSNYKMREKESWPLQPVWLISFNPSHSASHDLCGLFALQLSNIFADSTLNLVVQSMFPISLSWKHLRLLNIG